MEVLAAYLRRAKAMERTQLIRRYLTLGFGGFLLFAAGLLVDIHINGVELTAWNIDLYIPLLGRTAHASQDPPPG